VELSEGKAKVIVPEDQLSIAIGKSGQNVRLASKLTGYEIDIVAEKDAAPVQEAVEAKPVALPKLKKKTELENSLLEAIEEHGE
jgi:N utilization substance protein A